MFRRVGLMIAVNVLVMVTISVFTYSFGLNRYLDANGINYQSLALFCLVWGFGGAFISLGLSRVMAKFAMRVRIIDPAQMGDPAERRLVEMVHRHAKAARIDVMPQVGIYDSPEVNAFATGPTRNRALVAVSTGLLGRMNEREVEGVIGHEIAHVANGDMVTMTLIQGVVNAFAMFIARIIAHSVSKLVPEDARVMTNFAVMIVAEIALVILGSVVVASFSRYREFRADAGGANLAGREKMIAALTALQRNVEYVDPNAPKSVAAFRISGKQGGFLSLFSSHPPLEARIQRLKQLG